MRRLKRSIAHTLMELQGINHPNKKTKTVNGKKKSYFSLHWREVLREGK